MGRRTYTEIKHQLVDPTAKADVSYAMPDKLAASDLADIGDNLYVVEAADRATLEPNQWVLDGTKRAAPDDASSITWGAVTGTRTDDTTRAFAVPPVLTLTFGTVHTVPGLTFTFAGDAYPAELQVDWYYNTALLATETYNPTGMLFSLAQLVEDFNKIVITFTETSLPGRRVKIAELDYGQIVVWSKGKLRTASIASEVNPTGAEILIDTLDFSVIETSEMFNMLNPQGVYVALQKKQQLIVTEYLDGVAIAMGTFYLDTWENTSPVSSHFTAYSILGVFQEQQYTPATMLAGTAASVAFAAVFAAAGWTDYTIDATVGAELLYGYPPAGTVRQALQHLCVATRSTCKATRAGGVAIVRLPNATVAKPIEKNRKQGGLTMAQRTLKNSVAVTAYAFTLDTTTSALYKATLAAGTYDVQLSTPAATLTITGATIVSSSLLAARITVAAPGVVTITGYKYTPQTSSWVYEAPDLTAATRSQATVPGVFLISAENAAAVAQFIYEDYQRRILQGFTLTVEDEDLGDNVDVDTMLNARKTGVITTMNINLTGGFLAETVVRG